MMKLILCWGNNTMCECVPEVGDLWINGFNTYLVLKTDRLTVTVLYRDNFNYAIKTFLIKEVLKFGRYHGKSEVDVNNLFTLQK